MVESLLVDLALTGSRASVSFLSLTLGCFSVFVVDGVVDCFLLVGWTVLDGLGLVFCFTSSGYSFSGCMSISAYIKVVAMPRLK